MAICNKLLLCSNFNETLTYLRFFSLNLVNLLFHT